MLHHVLLLVYIAYLFLIIFLIFFDRKKPMLRMSWILLLTLVPGIGLLLYLLLGSDEFVSYRKANLRKRRRDLFRRLEGVAAQPTNSPGTSSAAQRLHATYCGSAMTHDNQVELFTTGGTKYPRLFQDLAAAKDHIHVQYFTIQNDAVGQKLIEILVDKAREGVEVKLLFDTAGCLLANPWALFRMARAAGVQVASIRPLLFDVNYRNHRKIVVIDGKIGYAGGMNVGKEYQHGLRGMPWRDTHLRITGSAVHQLQKVFLSDWVTSAKSSDMRLRHELTHYFPAPDPCDGVSAQVVANGLFATHAKDAINLGYFNLISRATRRVWIQTPYFVPSEPVFQALRSLAWLGVDVRIISSSTYVFGGAFHRGIANYYLRYLAACGVQVYRFHGVMHAKTLLIDDDKLCIGSVNLNSRSLHRDDELYVYFESRDLAGRYEAAVRADLEHSTRFDVSTFDSLPFGSRVMESLMSFFSPLS